MENIRLLIIFGLVALMYGCETNKAQECKATVTESEASDEESLFFRSYVIGKEEVRDTSFALPRRLLDDPAAFMKTLTDVQVINRFWTDKHNYPEKLLFGDSILRKICKKIAISKGKPVYMLDYITDEDNSAYFLEVGAKGDRSYARYKIMNDCVKERMWEMSEPFWNLLYEWDKDAMFQIGETDEWEKTIVSHTGQQREVCITGRYSGCITRLICDTESVYVDMVKLYLWPFIEY